jgi:Spy/CpxP family protein refolding chaperone
MNRTKFFSLSLALALMLAVSLSGLSVAEARSWGRGGPAANYTPEQQAELQALRDAHHTQTAPLYRQLQAKRAELEMLYYNDSKDSAKAQKIFRDMADIKAKLFVLNSEYRARHEAKGFRYGLGYNGSCGDGPGIRGEHGWSGRQGSCDDGPGRHRGGR